MPTFANVLLTDLTASRLTASSSTKTLESVTDLTTWIGGTTNQVIVTDDSDGTVTLSLPQDIHTSATPTFANVILADGGAIKVADGSPQIMLDNTNGYIKIPAGVKVGIGAVTPTAALHVIGDLVRIGTGGSVSKATGDGDLFIAGLLECDTVSFFYGNAHFMSDAFFEDTGRLNFGSSNDSKLGWVTNQTPDTFVLGLSDASRTMVITTVLKGFVPAYRKDYAHPAQDHPTVFFQSFATSSAAVLVEWGSLSFIGTNASGGYFNVATGCGDVVLAPSETETLRLAGNTQLATFAGNIVGPNDIWIGSVGEPNAIQIESDGDIVISQDLTVTGSIAAANYTAANILTACATNAGALDFSAASKTLTVEDDAVVSQDYSSDASPTFANVILADGGTIGQPAGPLITFDDTNNYLEITGCNVLIGDGGETNYSEFETDGTLKFNGAATVWNDANVGAMALTVPVASQPDEDNFMDGGGGDTGITTWAYAVGEKSSGAIEFPHDYKEGSDIIPHVHWQGIVAPTGTDKVKWQLTYTVGQQDITLDAATSIVIETDFDTQYEFILSNFPTITGTNFNIGDQFLFTIERIATSADAYAGDVLIATVGFHYECDTVGSRQTIIK